LWKTNVFWSLKSTISPRSDEHSAPGHGRFECPRIIKEDSALKDIPVVVFTSYAICHAGRRPEGHGSRLCWFVNDILRVIN